MSTPPAAPTTASAPPALRELTPADLPAALALTRAQRWSHQLHDWALHLRLGRGFGIQDADGRLLGTALWWDWDGRLATLGLVVVDPACQGRGIGRRLMQAILAETGTRPVGLVATAAGERLYVDLGFVRTGGILQCQGEVRAAATSPALPTGLRLRLALASDRPALLALDAAAAGAPRTALIDAVLEAGRPALLALRGEQPVGFALQRPAGSGITVGPLVADDEATAIALVAQTLDSIEGLVRLDVPATAGALVDYLGSRGLAAVDRVTAMLRGQAPPTHGTAQRFGLVSQAFG